MALVASLLAEVALAAFTLVHGVGDELASATELSLENVWLKGELLALPEPEGPNAMGVRAVCGAAPGGQLADQAETSPGAVTGTVTNGQGRRVLDVGCAPVHGWTASSGVGRLIQAGRGRLGGTGGLRTKRSGCAAWALERTTARAVRTWSARP